MVRERADRADRADRTNGSAPAPTSASASLSVAELRQLISLLDRSDLEEITIEQEGDGLHLTLRKPAPVQLDEGALLAASELGMNGATADPVSEAGAASENSDDTAGSLDVRSTLVGLYRAVARRGAKALTPGDSVKEGQIIGAVEALNVLNEIESPATGRVKAVLVSDGQPVEYGQALMLVEPREG